MHEIFVPIKLAFKNLRSNLGRTFLSLIGIVIGVASVIIVLSLGEGLRSFVIAQVETFGTDIVEIEVKVPNVSQTSTQNAGGIAGGIQITTFTLDEAKKVAKLDNVGDWYGGILSQQVTSRGNENDQSIIMGTSAGVFSVDKETKVDAGTPFFEENDENLDQVVVLGSSIKETLFGNDNAIGEKIKIKGQSFKVVGVLKKRGLAGFFDFDKIIYMPIQTLQKKIMGTDYIQFAIFKINDLSKIEQTITEIENFMRQKHDINSPDEDDFAVMSIAEAKDILDKVFSIINILLIALTSISLVVGGVGIMNVMYVAVTERTMEIGLRKSLGARNSNILRQFLFEAIFLTLLGGVLGVLVGFLIAQLASVIVSHFGFSVQFGVTAQAVLIGFVFSALTGITFGYYPARKASRLNPMEALRKE